MKGKNGILLLAGVVLTIIGVFLIALREPVVSPILQKALGYETAAGEGSVRLNKQGAYQSTNLGAMDLWQGVIVVIGGACFIGGIGIIGTLAMKHKLNSIVNDRSSMNR